MEHLAATTAAATMLWRLAKKAVTSCLNSINRTAETEHNASLPFFCHYRMQEPAKLHQLRRQMSCAFTPRLNRLQAPRIQRSLHSCPMRKVTFAGHHLSFQARVRVRRLPTTPASAIPDSARRCNGEQKQGPFGLRSCCRRIGLDCRACPLQSQRKISG